MIVIINGSNNSGKDQFVEFFIKHYKYGAVNMSTIDKVKKIAIKHFGWDGKKDEKSRKFLANIKKNWADYNNGPFLYMVKKIKEKSLLLDKKNKKKFVFFIHCREPEEIQKFKDVYGEDCLTLLLKRENRDDSKKVCENHADMGVDNYNYDKIVYNNTTKEDLEMMVINFIKELNND